MKVACNKRNKMTSLGRISALVIMALGLALGAMPAAGRNASGQDKNKKGSNKSAGFILSQDATAEDVGLPIYPGAQRLQDTPDESSAVQMGHSSGFKLVVLKLESSDSPEKIAAFYRNALAKYGEVLDCSKPAPKHKQQPDTLACDDDEPTDGAIELKAGTKEKEHVVGIETKGNHSHIALIYLVNPK